MFAVGGTACLLHCGTLTVLLMFQCSAVDWWSSLSSSIFQKHIEVFRETLAFTLKNNLLLTLTEDVQHLLKVLELLYKVSCCFATLDVMTGCVLHKGNPRSMFGKIYTMLLFSGKQVSEVVQITAEHFSFTR